MDQAAVAEPVDLASSLGNTVTVLESKARAASVAVAVQLEPGLPRVRGFVGELNQIWANVIDNALDAVPDGGRVDVTAAREHQRVVVRRDLRARYRESYMVVSATSGEEALATIRELKARGDELALVISDQRMPGIQGTEVLARSRETYPLAPRVMLTAYSDIDAAIKAINEAHLDHYLAKPWGPPEERLFPVVDDLLDTWQAAYLPEAKRLRLVGPDDRHRHRAHRHPSPPGARAAPPSSDRRGHILR